MTWEYCGYCGSIIDSNKRLEHECGSLYLCPFCGQRLQWHHRGVFITLLMNGEHYHGSYESDIPYVILKVRSVSRGWEDEFPIFEVEVR